MKKAEKKVEERKAIANQGMTELEKETEATATVVQEELVKEDACAAGGADGEQECDEELLFEVRRIHDNRSGSLSFRL